MCSQTPDTSKADANAAQITQLSADQFDWVKQQYEADAPNREAATKTAQQVSQAQLDLMNKSTAAADDYAAYNKGVFRPLEKQIVSDAQNYDTPQRREEAAGRAAADVQQAAGAAAADSQRSLTRMGVNPADGAYADMTGQRETATALGVAGSENRARTQVETLGAAKMNDAAALGRNLPSAQATQASLGLTAGNNSVSSAAVPSAVTQGGVNMVNQGAGNYSSGLQAGANIYSTSAKLSAGTDDTGAYAGLAGAAMTAFAI